MKLIQVFFWRFFAIVFLLLALIGIPLPGLPTVPFLLLSAWCSSRGWPRLERWLINHPQFGPPIVKWRTHGIVSRFAKWLATLMCAVSMVFMWMSPAPRGVALIGTLTIVVVITWLWFRPEQATKSSQ